MIDLSLKDLIDPQVLQEIQDGFANVTGMAALTADADGVPVTKGSNFTDFCSKLTRMSPTGCKRCEACDKNGGLETRRTGKPASYFCHAGLVDFASPITVEGQYIGSFIGGQVLTEEPDEAHYREIARDLEIDEYEFIEALHKVNIVPKEKIETACSFLHTISGILSSMAFTSYNTIQMNTQLISSIDESSKVVKAVNDISNQAQSSIRSLGHHFTELSSLANRCMTAVDECDEIVKVIQENATTTHILGLNASIEASRAKEDGKGFGVIAREVRGLADVSRQSSDVIKKSMGTIREHTSKMVDNMLDAKDMMERCIADIEQLKKNVEQLHGSQWGM